ncbi:hypothetical protein KKD19_05830 [Patescibacteria group bacterium]|nr:hypothetical protein [Patescibacteria group bacterium]MBU4512723.1 hypothetical protein [Patescibacteria group bacterium]MCG2693660.1 hypothetical protein [Candidatus Parcubacteria bacterium]
MPIKKKTSAQIFFSSFFLSLLIVIAVSFSLRFLEQGVAKRYIIPDDNHSQTSQPSEKSESVNTPKKQAPKKQNYQESFWCFVRWVFLIPKAQAAERTYYQAQRLEQSYPYTINLDPGKAMTFWVKYKNVGYYRWRPEGPRRVYLKIKDATGTTAKFRHAFWLDNETPTALKDNIVEVGKEATFKFAIQAPEEPGMYWLKFNLLAYGDWVTDGEIEIPVRVMGEEEYNSNLRMISESTNTTNDTDDEEEAGSLATTPAVQVIHKEIYEIEDLIIPEPDIRVGLYSLDEEEGDKVQISSTGAYGIYDTDDKLILTQTQGEMAEIQFDYVNKRYFINIDEKRLVSSDAYFTFKQKDENNIFMIENYDNPTYAGSEINYNQYRGRLEAQWVEDNERLWVINELAMEPYLKGSGETMDVSPYEFLKAMAIAERTYAMFHYLNPTKHAIRNFTVSASQSDQIYQGYAREIRQPNICRAVDDSLGLIVAYENAPALTLYFSQSNGQTKSYEQVYKHKSYPYLIAVEDPHMAGNRQIGHGVGISARGALFMASKDGANFEDILYHFYSGIEVKKVY